MKSVLKYIKIYFKMSKYSLMEQMEYKLNLIWTSSLELSIMISNIIFINVIYMNVDRIGGWTIHESIILVVLTALFDCMLTFFFVASLHEIPNYINQGTLDFIILKPINNRFYISFKRINSPQIINIIILTVILIYLMSSLDLTISIGQLFIFLVMIINGVFILYNILFMIMTLAFWVVKVDIGVNLFFQFFNIGNKPQQIFPTLFQKIFTYIIPLFAVFNFPINYLNNQLSIYKVLITLIISILLFLLSQYILKTGLKKYTSASS